MLHGTKIDSLAKLKDKAQIVDQLYFMEQSVDLLGEAEGRIRVVDLEFQGK